MIEIGARQEEFGAGRSEGVFCKFLILGMTRLHIHAQSQPHFNCMEIPLPRFEGRVEGRVGGEGERGSGRGGDVQSRDREYIRRKSRCRP